MLWAAPVGGKNNLAAVGAPGDSGDLAVIGREAARFSLGRQVAGEGKQVDIARGVGSKAHKSQG